MDEEFKEPDVVQGEECPICHQKTLTLTEAEREIPYFGRVYLFSMNCTNPTCKYSVSDVESEEEHDPMQYTLEIKNGEDLNARVIKSSEATVKIGRIASIEPGDASQGFISNVEGVLKRIERSIEIIINSEDDKDVRDKAKKQLKKIRRIMSGFDTVTISVSDPSGNSAIIHENVEKKPLKGSKKKI